MAFSICLICNKSDAKACTTCKSAFYCSKACQKIDWPCHQVVCKTSTKLPPRSKDAKLAILLTAEDPTPRLVWVPCPRVVPPSAPFASDEFVKIWLGEPKTETVESFVITQNEVRGYSLKHKVIIYARDNWLNDGSKPNQAALALTDWELPYDWRGNILIMSSSILPKNGPINKEEFQDTTLGDLRTAVDYLSRYGMDIKRGAEHVSLMRMEIGGNLVNVGSPKSLTEQKVKGVLIRCVGDMFGGRERYSEMEITKAHAVWKQRPTEASRFMGLPLLVHKLSPNPAWQREKFDNQAATYLNLTVDPKKTGMWGFAPPEWQAMVGSVVVVRQDGKDLSREQAWALAEYMQFKVSDAFEDSGDMRQRRATVLRMLNWKRFDVWLEGFKEEMTAADRVSWVGVRSPFGMRFG